MLPLLLVLSQAWADETVYKVQLKNHVMTPSQIDVKANESFWLEVDNQDNTSEEIESRSLNIEKIVPPRKMMKIKIRKLAAGQYDIFGDFHADKCKGTINATENASK